MIRNSSFIGNKVTYINNKWRYLKTHRAFKKSPILTITRAVDWSILCLFKIPKTIKISDYNIDFYLPPRLLRAGSTGIYVLREDYEPELAYLKQVLSPGQVFVDAGANFGIYTTIASRLVGDSGVVISFEPAVETYPILDRNVEINQLENVRVFHAAVSDREGITRFYHNDDAPNSYSLGAVNDETEFEEIETITLEKVFEQEKIKRFDLMKIDVEGAEELVLQGAKSLIEQMRPKIIFEVSSKGAQRLGLSQNGAWNLLQELGYSFFYVGENGNLKPLASPRLGNVVAIPRSKKPAIMSNDASS
jgi:FkbM family methyltransferase